jgi:glutamine cyclotransferase
MLPFPLQPGGARRTAGRLLLAAAMLLVLSAISVPVVGADPAPTLTARVVAVYPHDPDAFTQGLFFADGLLYEGTGHYGRSTLRAVDPASGRVLRQAALPADLFGEGITPWGDEIIQLTWRAGRILRWSRDGFEPLGELPLAGEGWGLTDDGRHWIVSDGSATLRFLDPSDGREVRRVQVRDGARPLRRINELEYIGGEVWANLWYRDVIVRIDPADGRVLGYVDLSDLWPAMERPGRSAVLNGIAYDPADGRLFVTGKYWPRLYQIEVVGAD